MILQEIQRHHKVALNDAIMIKRIMTRAQFASHEVSSQIVRGRLTSTEYQAKLEEIERHAERLIDEIKRGEIINVKIDGLCARVNYR